MDSSSDAAVSPQADGSTPPAQPREVPAIDPPSVTARHPRSQPRRLFEALLFVALWMAAGFGLHLSGQAYLALGIPLALAFQLFVARAPLRAAWVRSGPPFRWTGRLVTWSAALALAPLISIPEVLHERAWGVGLQLLGGALGAIGAAYAIQAALEETPKGQRANLLRWTLLSALPALAIMTFGGVAFHISKHKAWLPAPMLRIFAMSFLQYVPVCFAMEEVAFRGVLDAHVARPGDPRGASWLMAAVLSMAWGLWHLPTLSLEGKPASEIALAAAGLALIHLVYGLAFTWGWRKSGTLLVPAVGHSLADALRNALLSGR